MEAIRTFGVFVLRFFTSMPLIILMIIYCPFFWITGVKKPYSHCIDFWEKSLINTDELVNNG